MILETGIGLKLALAGSGFAGGIILVTGATTGGAQQTIAAVHPKTVATVCGYASQAKKTPTTKTRAAALRRPDRLPGKEADHRALAKLGLNARQRLHAKIIVHTAASRGLPERAAVIGIATSLQESDLGLKKAGDHGTSFGLFHQKPTSGYGTRRQILDPHHAAKSFFSRLSKVRNWQKLPLTTAVQKVQRSRYPHAYAKHERRARKIVSAVGSAHSSGTHRSRAAEPRRLQGTGRIPTLNRGAAEATVLSAASRGLHRNATITELVASLNETRSAVRAATSVRPKALLQARAVDLLDKTSARLCTMLSAKATSLHIEIKGSGDGIVAVRAALSMRGIPYSWGGGNARGPSLGIGRGSDTVGFDCSGLVEYAWAKAGARVGGQTDPQWRSGTKVPRSRLQPGDLLFFARNTSDPSTIHHVGMNLDGKRMIHAPQTGDVVKISRWSGEPYRERELIGAIRPAS